LRAPALRQVAVNAPQHPADQRSVVPPKSDHSRPRGAHTRAQACRPGPAHLILTFDGAPLQKSGTSQADTDVGM